MARVYNLKGSEEIPDAAVFVGRPSRFGNPFVIGTHGSRADVIAAYREWLSGTEDGRTIAAIAKIELVDKDLVCYCAPKACHADILLEITNGP